MLRISGLSVSPSPPVTGLLRTGLFFSMAAMVAFGAVACSDDESASAEGGDLTTVVRAASLATGAVQAAAALVDNSCLGMPLCSYRGQCTLVDNLCRATTAEQCRSSLACRDWGECAPLDGRCLPQSEADCRQAWTCKLKGRCSPVAGKCVAASDGDCRRSELCKYHRKCSERSGRCVKKK